MEKLGKNNNKKKTSRTHIPRLGEIAANGPSLPIPGLMRHKPWGRGGSSKELPHNHHHHHQGLSNKTLLLVAL